MTIPAESMDDHQDDTEEEEEEGEGPDDADAEMDDDDGSFNLPIIYPRARYFGHCNVETVKDGT